MERIHLLFLDILRNSLKNKKVNWDDKVTLDDWRALYKLSSIHSVIPLFAHTVFECTSLNNYPEFRSFIISKANSIVIRQAKKSASFVTLYQEMLNSGLKPIVMKGIICRNLYSEPEQRPSFDEDILIFPWQINKYHQFFISHGFNLVQRDIDIEKNDEISYENKNTHLYFEVHKYLFPLDTSAISDLNNLFSVLEDRHIEKIYDVQFCTFGYTDHLLYMICHAFKHFLYSGIGIRQICDICLFTKTYGNQINWSKIYESCRYFRIDSFMSAIFKICEKYLDLDRDNFIYKDFWDDSINEESLLNDILFGGLYGTADENRLHSSNMTLEVVSAQKEGRRPNSLIKAILPDIKYMKRKYSYLKNNKWLLPVAWIHRGYDYFSQKQKRRTSPVKTIEIGNNRIKILREYHIID